jgi:hypothetical protein
VKPVTPCCSRAAREQYRKRFLNQTGISSDRSAGKRRAASSGNTSHVNPEKQGCQPEAACAGVVVQESARWIEWIRATSSFRKIADLTQRNDMAEKSGRVRNQKEALFIKGKSIA